MRYLAIDLGARRTGLAFGDDETVIATPHDTVVTSDPEQRLVLILREIEREQPDALVIGLPLNMDGTEGPGAKEARSVAEELTRRTGLTAHLADERLSTAEADEQMSGHGLTRKDKKNRRDALAAAAILRRFLESLNQPGDPDAASDASPN